MAASNINLITRAGIIGALYFMITVSFAPLSYGILQVRISEALTVVPFFEPAAIWGLFIGCMLANIYGGNGPWDIFGGSLITLIAAFFTWRIKTPFLSLLPPVILNAFGIAYILVIILKIPEAANYTYLLASLYIGAGEAIVVYLLGYPLLKLILRKQLYIRNEVARSKKLWKF